MSLPDASRRAAIESSVGELVAAIEHHAQRTPPTPNRTLYFVWDFVQRTKYMFAEVDNIQNSRPLQHPEQFRPAPGSGPQAAVKVFDDACGRCQLVNLLVTDTSGKTAMMTGQAPGEIVDFGAEARACCGRVLDAVGATMEE